MSNPVTYRLPFGVPTSVCSAGTPNPNGSFTVLPGSIAEAQLLAAGAMAVGSLAQVSLANLGTQPGVAGSGTPWNDGGVVAIS